MPKNTYQNRKKIRKLQQNKKTKKLVFDPKKYKFKCLQCGNCCGTFSAKGTIAPFPSFNHKGFFVKNPKLGINILSFEIDKMRQNLTPKQLLKINYGFTFFLKDYPIGFVTQYQIRYNKYDYCSFFNFKTKKCNIYNFRPLVCRIFPLSHLGNGIYVFGEDDLSRCKSFQSEIMHQNSIKPENIDKDMIQFSNLNLTHSFPPFVYEKQKLNQTTISQNIFLDNFSNIILSPNQLIQLIPNKIKIYKLLDLKNFTKWFRTNIKNKKLLEKLNNYEEQLKFSNKISNIYKKVFKSIGSKKISKKLFDLKINNIIKNEFERK